MKIFSFSVCIDVKQFSFIFYSFICSSHYLKILKGRCMILKLNKYHVTHNKTCNINQETIPSLVEYQSVRLFVSYYFFPCFSETAEPIELNFLKKRFPLLCRLKKLRIQPTDNRKSKEKRFLLQYHLIPSICFSFGDNLIII